MKDRLLQGKGNGKGFVKKKFKYIVSAIVLIIVVGGYLVYRNIQNSKLATTTTIKEQKASQGDIKIDYIGDGTVSLPVKSVDFKVAGTIKNIYVKPGQQVKKGDVLADLDTVDLEKEVTKAEIAYNKSALGNTDAVQTAELNIASEKQKTDDLQKTYENNSNSVTSQLATENQKVQSLQSAYTQLQKDYAPMLQSPDLYAAVDIDAKKVACENANVAYETEVKVLENLKAQLASTVAQAKNSYEVQKKRYESIVSTSNDPVETARLTTEDLKNALDTAKENLKNAVITAPSDGKILYIYKAVGDTVNIASSSSSSTSATTTTADTGHVMVFLDTNVIQVKSSVAESDMKNISFGQKVEVQVDATGDQALTGKVISIDNIPKVDSSGVVTYQITSELDDSSNTIMEGMTSVIDFIIKEKQNVVNIPNKAVKMENGKQMVEVKDKKGQISKKQITTGLSDGENVEVVSGLTRGETVIIRSGK